MLSLARGGKEIRLQKWRLWQSAKSHSSLGSRNATMTAIFTLREEAESHSRSPIPGKKSKRMVEGSVRNVQQGNRERSWRFPKSPSLGAQPSPPELLGTMAPSCVL